MTETTPPPEDPIPQPPEAKAPRTGKGLRWALGVSLALNLLVAGVLAGAGIAAINGHERKGGAPGLASFGQGIGPVIQSFEPQDRRAMARQMRRGAQELGVSRRNVEVGLQRLSDQIGATPYDQAALEATMTGQIEQIKAVQDLAFRVILERISAMSDEERARLAADLEVRSKEFVGGRPPPKNRN